MKLIIDRSRWLRGESESYLFRPRDNKMCCLGFYGKACGLSEEQMSHQAFPSEVEGYMTKAPWLAKGADELRSVSDFLMLANDSKSLSESDREKKIADIFAQHGVEVEFIDGGFPE